MANCPYSGLVNASGTSRRRCSAASADGRLCGRRAGAAGERQRHHRQDLLHLCERRQVVTLRSQSGVGRRPHVCRPATLFDGAAHVRTGIGNPLQASTQLFAEPPRIEGFQRRRRGEQPIHKGDQGIELGVIGLQRPVAHLDDLQELQLACDAAQGERRRRRAGWGERHAVRAGQDPRDHLFHRAQPRAQRLHESVQRVLRVEQQLHAQIDAQPQHHAPPDPEEKAVQHSRREHVRHDHAHRGRESDGRSQGWQHEDPIQE